MIAQIQIQFPRPGQWDKMTMTAVYEDAAAYTHADTYTQDDIPADQAPALASVVSALVGLAAPWQAVQVWARLAVVYYEDDLDPVPIAVECVVLTVEAVNDQGGRRMFDITDYSEFFITDASAVSFFKHFTKQ